MSSSLPCVPSALSGFISRMLSIAPPKGCGVTLLLALLPALPAAASVTIDGAAYAIPTGAVLTSSNATTAYLGGKAFDGTSASDSRWATTFLNTNAASNSQRTEWIMIDLGKDVSLKSISFNWETARAVSYKLGVRTDAQGIASGMATVPVQGPTVQFPASPASSPISFSDWTQIGSVSNAASIGNSSNLAAPDQVFNFASGTTTGTSVGAMTINENPAVGRYLLVDITQQWSNGTNTGSSPYEIGIVANSYPEKPPVRIMPLGDSITYGAGAPVIPGGYRNKLYQILTAAGYNVDFVGNQTGNGTGTLPDSDHEGHPAWTISQLDANLTSWFGNIADPDVILLHIGTNDFGTAYDTAHAIDRLDSLITKMATMRPRAHIIVTNLMERGEPYNSQITAQFNPYVQARVNAQAALGRRVTFLDMRSAVPLSEMPDQLHPGQAGYDHMADAWAQAIEAVIGTSGDTTPPEVVRAVGASDMTHVSVTFSKPVSDAAADVGNYSITGDLVVTGAALDAAKRSVVLTTGPQTHGRSYAVTVNNVVDRTAGHLAMAPNSTVNFSGAAAPGYLNNVAEAAGYTLVYSLDVPNTANYSAANPVYTVDHHVGMGPFSRIAYYMELQAPGGDLQYVWVSMDAFTTDAGKIALPTLASAAVFQQGVTGMNVRSNNPRVTTGSNLTGNLEFWPNNYDTPNATNVSGAENLLFDFGDTRSTGTSGGTYGSMQVHNTGAHETVFGFNNWGGSATGGNVDIGMGNNPVTVNNATDWTFANNGALYTVKRLQVLVNAPYEVYLDGFPSLTGSGRSREADPDGDGLINLGEFAFGTDPASPSGGALAYTGTTLVKHGTPTVAKAGAELRAAFLRRKDYVAAGLTYTVQFSADLKRWTDSPDTPATDASDSTMDAVSVAFPALVPIDSGNLVKPRFFRVKISAN